ncbi:MAG: hypothetical protein K8H85_04270 [Cyclobacteriaceae bacterium]|nr:hypothetical protein [Cyclobacteriaceae bacterium]
MVTINFETIDERLAELKRSRADIRYVVVGKAVLTTPVKTKLSEDDKSHIVAREISSSIVSRVKEENASDLERQLWIEFNAIKTERNKASSQIWKMVENGATQAELAEHYELIESFRPGLIALYDKIQHVKQYGALPAAPEPAEENLDPYFLKDRKKKLVDKRCKLRAKLRTRANPSKPAKILEWEQELALADMEYKEVEEKLKQIEGKG